MKKCCTKVLAFTFLISFILQGCSLPNQPYVKKDVSEATPLKVVRYLTPDIRRYSTGEGVAIFLGSAIILDPLVGLLVISIYHDVKKVPDDQNIPDYGKLVMDKFIDRAKNEIPGWPAVVIEEKPIWEALKDESNYILEFKADSLEIKDSEGLRFVTVVTMKDKGDNVIWEKGYKYLSEQFNHKLDYDQLKKDSYKLLKEEMVFAADATVTAFIEHFKNPQSGSPK
ncbi:MAG: hypothetical protein ABSC54_04455 [Smithellaceae bacterium]|jgi:hypothetical protein